MRHCCIAPPPAAFEDSQKRFLVSAGLFPALADAVLSWPHNEALCTNAVIFFYFMADEIVKAREARRLVDDAMLCQVGAWFNNAGGTVCT